MRLRFFAVIPKIYLSTWRKKFGTGDPVHHPVTGESSDRPGMTKIAHFSKFQYFLPKFKYMNDHDSTLANVVTEDTAAILVVQMALRNSKLVANSHV